MEIKQKELKRKDLLYPELSYRVIGALFDVFNELGYGYRELFYQRALEQRLKELKIPFTRESRLPVVFHDKKIGWQTPDFIIDNKIILELKQGSRLSKKEIEQVTSYLKAGNKKLGILARFSTKGLAYRRVLYMDSYIRKNS